MENFSRIDDGTSPPKVDLPRHYNAAVDFVDRQPALGHGGKTALIDDAGGHSYDELRERANRAGNALAGLGVGPEQRVLLCMLDGIDFAAVFFGAMKAGMVPVPVNTLLTEADYEYMLADSRAPVAVVSAPLLPKLAPLAGRLPQLRHIVVAGGAADGHADLAALSAAASPALAPAATTADDVAFWLYSSGSTGRPKGAVHLHGDLVQTVALYARGILRLTADDVVFSAAKMFFAYGLGNSLSFPLYLGATAVAMAERPSPEATMRVMKRHQPTVFFGVPTLYGAILADPRLTPEEGSRRLRLCVSAGEALPRQLGERWQERFGAPILDGIGSTEMLHIFISNRPEDNRYGSTGRPVPGYRARLIGDDGAEVASGEIGDLLVHGPSCSPCYWNDRARSLATFHGPWTVTGDKYVRDEDGYYTYAGRSDDMLKVGGIWVSPFEVESALGGHERVLEAAVVGQADADELIKPKAFVVLKQGAGDAALAAELQGFVKDRLAPYKYPRWIEFVDELPKTATGKIQRFKLRR